MSNTSIQPAYTEPGEIAPLEKANEEDDDEDLQIRAQLDSTDAAAQRSFQPTKYIANNEQYSSSDSGNGSDPLMGPLKSEKLLFVWKGSSVRHSSTCLTA